MNTWNKANQKQKQTIEQLGMGHQFYIQLSMEVLGGGGGAGSILTGLNCLRLSRNFVFYCNAARPFQTEFIFAFFFLLSVYLFYGLFIIYPSIARSRWSRLQAISIYSAARRLLFSLFPNTNVANFSAINCNVYISCHHHNLRKQDKKIKSNQMNP